MGADDAASIYKRDFESGPSLVTLSEAKGLSRWALRCFAAAQHDKAVTPTIIPLYLLNSIIDLNTHQAKQRSQEKYCHAECSEASRPSECDASLHSA